MLKKQWFRGVKTLFKKLSRCSYQRTVQYRSGRPSPPRTATVITQETKRKPTPSPLPAAQTDRAQRHSTPSHHSTTPRFCCLSSPPATKEPRPFHGSALACSLRFRLPLFARGNRSELAGGAPRARSGRGGGGGAAQSRCSGSERWRPRRGRRRRGTSGSCGGSSSCRPTADASTATGS